jgi:hypothetical protein
VRARPQRFAYFIFLILFPAWMVLNASADDEPVRPKAHGILANYFQAPISFEPNQGQTDARVKFMARGSGYNLFLTASNALFSLRHPGANDDLAPKESEVLAMNVVGANPTPKMRGIDELPGKSSYFLGSDPRKWHTNIPNFGKVQYEDIYPGIDLVYHGTKGQLEYDFVVHPGTSPKVIMIEFTGAKRITLSTKGELVLKAETGQICFHKPVAYQQDNGNKRFIHARYVLIGKDQVSFAVGAYDSKKTLIIDPILSSPTFDSLCRAANRCGLSP